MKRVLSALSGLLACVIIFSLTACGKKPLTWQEQYDLGVRYLSEGNYEEAIIAFTAAIELDAMRADAYISLAEVYRAQGDTDKMMELLEQGFNETRDERLLYMISAEKENSILLNLGYGSILRELYEGMKTKNWDQTGTAIEKLDTEANPKFENVEDYKRVNWEEYPFHSPTYGRYGAYIFDGEAFTAESDGVGLLFQSYRKFYFGEYTNWQPNGKGTEIYIDASWALGGMNYYVIDGNWEDGKAIGEATICEHYTPSFVSESATFGMEIECVFDANEVMQTGELYEYWEYDLPAERHGFRYSIVNGKLIPSEWVYDDAYKYYMYINPCEEHADCGKRAGTGNLGEELFDNPYPWNGEPADHRSKFNADIGHWG